MRTAPNGAVRVSRASELPAREAPPPSPNQAAGVQWPRLAPHSPHAALAPRALPSPVPRLPSSYLTSNTREFTGDSHSTPRDVTTASSSSGIRNFLPPHSGIGVYANSSIEKTLLGRIS